MQFRDWFRHSWDDCVHGTSLQRQEKQCVAVLQHAVYPVTILHHVPAQWLSKLGYVQQHVKRTWAGH